MKLPLVRRSVINRTVRYAEWNAIDQLEPLLSGDTLDKVVDILHKAFEQVIEGSSIDKMPHI